jgi:hypothetical protein
MLGYRNLITRTYWLLDRSPSGLHVHLDTSTPSRRLVDGSFKGPLRGSVGSRGPDRDLVGVYRAGVYLVSDRFVDVLTGHGLEGWRVQECSLAGLPGRRLWLLQVLGRAGRQWVWTGSGDVPGRADPDPGDGLDFFLTEGSSTIYLSAEAASRLKAARLRNVLIEPTEVVFLPR